MKLKTLIIDDEIMARKAMHKYSENNPHLQVIGESENAEEALKVMDKLEVDLMLLDIEMPGMSGLELLDKLPYFPHVVFTTSKAEYAYDAFEYDVVDFLKKPITKPRFDKAIDKVITQVEKEESIASQSAKREMYIREDGKYIRIPFDTILYFENVGDYISIKTTNGNHIMHGALKSLDNKLSNPNFLKVHRSFIVNMEKIKDIEDNTLVIDKKVIPISRAHKPILLKSINFIS